MLFALLCNDKPDHLQVRTDTHPAISVSQGSW